ncbi:MAG: hypothetical protein ACE5NJ_12195, partial [Thermodesulfobacteriota bacterium]
MVPERDQSTYKVIFFGIANKSAEGRKNFLRDISKRFHISPEKANYLISKTPILLKRGLSRVVADALVKEFESLGGRAQFIREEETPLLELEFEADKKSFLQVESLASSSKGGRIEVVGRVKNISSHPLRGVKVVAQFFDFHDQFVIYEESPIAFSILDSGQCSPFKVMGKANTGVGRISLVFKGEDGGMIPARIGKASPQKVALPRRNNPSETTTKAILEPRDLSSKGICSLLDEVFSRIPKDEFMQVEVEEALRTDFPEEWASLEKKYGGADGESTRQSLAGILSWYAQEQGSSIRYTGTSVEGPPGWGIPKMAVYKKVGSNFPPSPRAPLAQFDGQSPLRNFSCPQISQKSPSSIARALIKGYNEEKIPHDLRNFNHRGFNAKSLVSEEDVLLKFLSLVLFDRWPFRPWEI